MFPEKLQKILQLIKKTGDRVIVFDSASHNDAFVLMDFEAYADLVEEINITPVSSVIKDKSDVQALNVTDKLSVNLTQDSHVNEEKNEPTTGLTEEDLTDKINREISVWKNQEDSAYLGEEIKAKRPWTIPPQVKDKAQIIE